jgi:hypothetical protein
MAFPPIEPFVISADLHVPGLCVRAQRLCLTEVCAVKAGSNHNNQRSGSNLGGPGTSETLVYREGSPPAGVRSVTPNGRATGSMLWHRSASSLEPEWLPLMF